MDILNEFNTIANSLTNNYLEKWIDEGKKVIGFTCSYVPEEIMYAAGMLPFRIRGIGATSTSLADSYYGPVNCSFPKCVLQLVGDNRYTFLDGVVIMPSCDSMRRLDDTWRKAAEDSKGSFPAYHSFFGVPHKVTHYSLEWFVEEIRNLIASLENHFEIKITDRALKNAIKQYNESRDLLMKLDELRCKDAVPISGADATAVIIASGSIPRSDYNELLKKLLNELKKNRKGVKGKKRLMIGGSPNDDVALVKLIESSGGIIVADTLCFGSRAYVDRIDEDEDPVVSIARRYLSHRLCPRMFGAYKNRLEFTKERAAQAKIDGVILQNIRFCDMHGSENSLFERDLEAMGIPCLKIEREYGFLADEGRIKMRVDAFIESLQ
jgi:benzoyl-CoA reductase/2-hydroxyglutaryl-CoA dehydratase subunit BcrC/BadD/HgdB